MLNVIIVATVFVLSSGLMALIEASVLSVTAAEVESMVQSRLRGAARLKLLKSRMTSAVVVMVVVTNVINVLGPVLVGTLAVELYGSTVLGIVTALLTFGTIVFSEIIPKSLGTHYAPSISRTVAPFLWLLTLLFLPVVWLFERLTTALKSGERRVGTEDQIRSLVRVGHSAGYIETDETQMVHRVFQLNDTTAGAIMTAAAHVITVPAEATVDEALKIVVDTPYSRFPAIAEDGSVEGVVLSRDLLGATCRNENQTRVADLIRPPILVDAAMPADDLLTLFRARRFHMAIVQEDGMPKGVVTLEDVLEEIVGEIYDERDSET